MSDKKLVRFNIQSNYLELIDAESDKRGMTKHEYLNYVLYEFLVKRDNRLSNHIARDNENLLLMLLSSPSKKYENLKEIIDTRKDIDRVKRAILHEDESRTTSSSFWNKLLTELHPTVFGKIKTTSDAAQFTKRLYRIVIEHQGEFI